MGVSDFSDLKPYFVFFGMAVLLPWNAVLNLMFEYNQYVMPKHGTDPVKNMSLGTSAYSSASILIMFLLSGFGNGISLTKQMYLGYFLLTLTMGCFGAVSLLEFGTDAVFYLTMAICIIIGLSGGISQGSMFASAGMLNPVLSVSGMVGVGVSGLVGLFLVVMVKIFLPYPADPALHATHFSKILLIFSSISAILIGVTLELIRRMLSRQEVKAKFGIQNEKTSSVCDEARLSDGGEVVAINSEVEGQLRERSTAVSPVVQPAAEAASEKEMEVALLDPLQEVETHDDESKLESRGVWYVVKDTFPMLFTCGSVFFMTFIVFPAISLRMRPRGQLVSVEDADHWYGVMIIGAYQLGDLSGRLTLDWGVKVGKAFTIVFGMLRYCLIPLFVLAVRADTQYSWMLNDYYQLGLVAAFGWTAGWNGSHCFLYASDYVKRDSEKQQLGFLMSLALLLGITLGSQAANLVIPFC